MPKFSEIGQVKIQEMSFMIIAVLIFFILVGLFGLTIVYNNLYNSANQIAEERTLAAIINLASSAEFTCPDNKVNCVDEDKIMSLKSKSIYQDFWEFKSLRIIKYAGFNKTDKELIKCELNNYPNCDLIEVYDSKTRNIEEKHTFIALCRREFINENKYEHCEIAMMLAGFEIKVPGENG